MIYKWSQASLESSATRGRTSSTLRVNLGSTSSKLRANGSDPGAIPSRTSSTLRNYGAPHMILDRTENYADTGRTISTLRATREERSVPPLQSSESPLSIGWLKIFIAQFEAHEKSN